MNLTNLNYGIIHSLVGKNDGVSIVIDQSVKAMVEQLNIPLGNIFFLAAYSTPRFNLETDDIFWHKNDINKKIVAHFSGKPPRYLADMIEKAAEYASRRIEKFITVNQIDLIIAHNISHPYNFITAVGLGRYLERRRASGFAWPKVMVWWHDSYYERPAFLHPNDLIRQYLRYLPGTSPDGIVFINREQQLLAENYYQEFSLPKKDFFPNYTAVIPNTCDIEWDWQRAISPTEQHFHPAVDPYNQSFFQDIGLMKLLKEAGKSLRDTYFLLQHTRIVPRKKIETAIDLAFKLALKAGPEKCIALIVSGYSGDEQNKYKNFLRDYYEKLDQNRDPMAARVFICFAENRILAYRDVIVDRKFYSFKDIPALIASVGGIGTYFSDIEGFGNNLLEMLSGGLPVIINRYRIYKDDIEPMGFCLPGIDDGKLTDEAVDAAWQLLTDYHKRHECLKHNLAVMDEKLNHRIMSDKLKNLLESMFFRV